MTREISISRLDFMVMSPPPHTAIINKSSEEWLQKVNRRKVSKDDDDIQLILWGDSRISA